MRHLTPTALTLAGLLTLTACGGDEENSVDAPADDAVPAASSEAAQSPEGGLSITVQDPTGDDVGTVEVTADEAGATMVSVEVDGLEPGFHGFHVHTTGKCEPDSADPNDPAKTGDFLSAGGHLAEEGTSHGEHTGDLPSLLVVEDGTGMLEFTTDRFTEEDLADEDGSAFMVHSGRDNFANIPERYAPDGADDDTLGAGDAGDRVACGVVEPG